MARVNRITQFLPATHTTILTLLHKHSPDGTTRTRRHTSDIAYYSTYRPMKNERLSWPSRLTYSGRFTHISSHPSAAGRAWDRESSPVKYQRSNHSATQPTKFPGTGDLACRPRTGWRDWTLRVKSDIYVALLLLLLWWWWLLWAAVWAEALSMLMLSDLNVYRSQLPMMMVMCCWWNV